MAVARLAVVSTSGKAGMGQSLAARRREARHEREQAWTAVLLAWVAGVVDAVGFLTLFKLFTAHMSGNSVQMGLRLGEGQWGEALRRGVPIPLYVVGVALGAFLIEAAGRRGIRSTFALPLGLEVAALIAFIVYGHQLLYGTPTFAPSEWQYYVLMALPVLAMGLQSSTLLRFEGRTIRTNYVTGMLTNFAEDVVTHLFWLRDRTRGKERRRLGAALRLSPRQPTFNRAMVGAGIWSSYSLGAIIGGYVELRWVLRALVLPLIVLTIVIIIDLIRPIHSPGHNM